MPSAEELSSPPLALGPPSVADGADLWRLAAASGTLDVNSPYAYLLWCRDFAATSVVARIAGEPTGFIIGFRRPEDPATVLVWQVAVDARRRKLGIAGRMLDHLVDRLRPLGVTHVETTVTPDNEPSGRLFLAFAQRWEAPVEQTTLFRSVDFPDGHQPEELYRIGPLSGRPDCLR